MDRREFLRATATSFVGMGLRGGLLTTAACTGDAAYAIAHNAAAATVFCNQIGYLPLHAKQATVTTRARSFTVQRLADSSVVFRGSLSAPRPDPASGDGIQIADFSSLKDPGQYRLLCDTGDPSLPFPIGATVYQDALRATMRAFYGQRCGCAVDLGGGYAHPVCHLDAAYHPSSGKKGPIKNHGGWHDAGDYGRYVVNSGLSTGTLLWAWELYAPALRSLSLQIPESGGPVPEYLAEVRWNLAWMQTLQDKDGGLWHKQTSEKFCGFVMPQDDPTISYVIGTGSRPYKSTCATADFAAVMAIAARCYGPYAPDFARQCLLAARKAWAWCQRHPDVTFQNPPGISTGAYGDKDCTNAMQWAAAELWRTTGESAFQQAFLQLTGLAGQRLPSVSLQPPSWNNVYSMACWSYALAMEHAPDAATEAIRTATAQAAAGLLQQAAQNGYGNSLAIEDYIWGSNGVACNHSMLLLVAHHFQPSTTLVDAALANLHYLLGRNCLGISWVTQLGVTPYQHPHHRPSIADAIAAPWPGLLSGGPNARPADKVAILLPRKPPMRMYIDNDQAYSMNEVAINWNAPLVFLLAAACS